MSFLSQVTLPAPGHFISPVKLASLVGIFIAWLHVAQWVSRDTQHLKILRLEFWQGIVLGGGALGIAAWMFLPWQGGLFAVGGLVWFLLAGGSGIAYVVYRNNQVVDAAKVLTLGHLKRTIEGMGKSKAEKAEAIEKVKLTDHEGRGVNIPEEADEIDDYIVVQDFLFDCMWRRASEVNLVVQGETVRLAHRVDGAVTERDAMSRDVVDRLLRFLRRIAGQDPEELRRPQTGTIQAALAGVSTDKVEISVRTEGSTAGQRLYLRITTDEARFRLPDLGLTRPQVKQVRKLVAVPHGLVIFSAPKRNGLTSTLYAALRGHDGYIQHLHTLERSPVMDLDNVTQNVHAPDSGEVTYAGQLATILRREPDVVMVESCDDPETATTVATAAVGERKIYMGLVADDTFEALQKYLNQCEDRAVAAQGLIAVVCQRLIRKLCPACKQAYQPDPQVLRKANLAVPKDQVFYQPPEPEVDKKGNPILCPSCQGVGYYGRTGVFEVFVIDDPIREMIKGNVSIKAIRDQARKNQMRYVWEEGLEKVKEGTTGMDEILRVLRPSSKGKK